MENWNTIDAQAADNQDDWHQAATEGQWLSPVSENAMHLKADDDDDEPTAEDWGDVDPQPSTGADQPTAPGSAV